MNHKEFDIQEFYRKPIYMDIIINLIIHQELSLSQLAHKLKKSKSTLHRYIIQLIEYNLIELSKEEKVRGSIKAKYFKLSKNKLFQKINHFSLQLKHEDQSELSDINKGLIYTRLHLFLYILKNNIDTFIYLLKKTEYKDDDNLILRTFNEINPLINVAFLDENQFDKINSKLEEFNKLFRNITSKNSEKNKKNIKPYFFATTLFEIEKLLSQKTDISNKNIKYSFF